MAIIFQFTNYVFQTDESNYTAIHSLLETHQHAHALKCKPICALTHTCIEVF